MGSKDREFAEKIRAKQRYQIRLADYEANLDSLRLIVKNMGSSFRKTIANIEADFKGALERIEALEKKDAGCDCTKH